MRVVSVVPSRYWAPESPGCGLVWGLGVGGEGVEDDLGVERVGRWLCSY